MPRLMSADAQPSVAVLGTGIMGAPMARRLARAGLEVAVWNRTEERARSLEGEVALVARSPAEAAAGRDAVVTMLADATAVEHAMAGGQGALAAMDGAALWLQMSTVGIAGLERLALLAEERGVTLVDAPVLGTRAPAEQGKLVVLAAGPDDVRERCAPVFGAVGQSTIWLGGAGAGTRLKMVVQHWITTLVVSLGETLALAEALDVDPARFLEVIDGSAVGSPYAQLKGRAMIERDFTPSASLDMMVKDVALVLEAAARHEHELALAPAVLEHFRRAAEHGHGGKDMAAAYLASTPRH